MRGSGHRGANKQWADANIGTAPPRQWSGRGSKTSERGQACIRIQGGARAAETHRQPFQVSEGLETPCKDMLGRGTMTR